MTQRTERIDELLRQEITSLLAKDIADPRIGFATVTDVETTPDLRHARVWVSVIGPREDRVTTVRALERAMPFVRHELGRRLRLRRIPEFSVRLDDSIERGSRVIQLLNELGSGGAPVDLPDGESLPTPRIGVPREDAGDEAGMADPGTTGAARGPRARSRPGGPGATSKGASRSGSSTAPASGGSRPSSRKPRTGPGQRPKGSA